MLGPVLAVEPSVDLTVTGDRRMILSIQGIDVSSLILGSSIADQAKARDDFVLDNVQAGDIDGVILTAFAQPVTTILVLEKDGTDSGMLRPLDAQGLPLGGLIDFATSDQSQWTFPVPGLWPIGGMVITSEVRVYGLEVSSSRVDPMSVSAVPTP